MRCSWVSLSFRSRYGIPYSVVPATQTFQDVDFTRYASESDPGPNGWIGTNPMMSGASNGETMYPFFTGMHLEGNPMPGGTPPSQAMAMPDRLPARQPLPPGMAALPRGDASGPGRIRGGGWG